MVRIVIRIACHLNSGPSSWPILPAHCARLPPRILASLCLAAQAQDKELNLYSARHYQTDEALYANFTKATGIKINRIDTDDAGVITRLKAEGAASPADVVLLVDAARLSKAESEGLFQPVKSATLQSRIPANLRGADDGNGSQWFGFSTRARVIVYDKAKVQRADVDTYEELADPKNKGKLCTRSGSHPYNLSLFGAVLQHDGAPATEAWLKGLVDNMARAPKGGDTDQIMAVASGECGVALVNSYYLARLMRSGQARGQGRDGEGGGGVPEPAELGHARQHRRRRGRQTRQAPRRSGAVPGVPGQRLRRSCTSPTATTNGRRWPA